MFGISEVAILIVVALLVFGAKKLPEVARSAGKSARILKSEAKALKDGDTSGQATYTAGPAQPASPEAPSADKSGPPRD